MQLPQESTRLDVLVIAPYVAQVLDLEQQLAVDLPLPLAGTELADATCESLRLKLLKIGARVKISVRRIHVSMASSHPFQTAWRLAQARLAPG